MGLSSMDIAVESLLWKLILIHLEKIKIPKNEYAQYQVLLDINRSFPPDFFEVKPNGLGWSFQMMTVKGIKWARSQAWAWRTCWIQSSTVHSK